MLVGCGVGFCSFSDGGVAVVLYSTGMSLFVGLDVLFLTFLHVLLL